MKLKTWPLFFLVIVKACSCFAELSLEQKIGGILMVGFRGMSVDRNSPVVRDILEYKLGGVILFDADLQLKTNERNIRSPEQLAELTGTLQSYANGSLLIAIDQEGGLVNRLKPAYGFPSTFSQQYLGELNDPEVTYQETLKLAAVLKAAGINLNLAPVVDLAVNPDNFIVKKERTFSADPGKTICHAAQFIRAHHEQDVLCTLKHFPGHGSSTADSHKDMTDVTQTWREAELEPYRQLCKATDVVMTAHIFQRNLDPELPATLSKRIITGLLRTEIGYDGVVMTDDLCMKAIADHYGFETALEYSLNAGADILLIANNETYDPDMVPETVQTVAGLVRAGRVPESRIDEAFCRVARLKDKVCAGCRYSISAEKSGRWYQEVRDLYYGLPVQVKYCPEDTQLTSRVWDYLESVDDVFNDYKPGSEISAINRLNAAGNVTLSPMLAEAFEKSRQAWQFSEGVFDVSCSPLRKLWKQAAKGGMLPAEGEIMSARERCGMKVEQDGARLILLRDGLVFDFGGIVKGIIADHVITMLKEGGAQSALVQIGGETAAFGLSQKDRPFRIAVQHPEIRDGTWCVIQAAGAGLSTSTSGNYEQPILINGKEFYHIMDPRTGYPAKTDILSVSIAFPQTGKNWLADSLSTTGVLLGPDKTFSIVKKFGGEAMFLIRENGQIKEITSPGWETLK